MFTVFCVKVCTVLHSVMLWCDIQVKSGFACEEDLKTIKSQISDCVQQLKREREVRRSSTAATTASVIDSQPAVITTTSQMPSVTSTPSTAANRQSSQEKDGCVDGLFILCHFMLRSR